MPNRKILSIFRKNNKQEEPEIRKKIKQQIAEPLTKEDIKRIDERLEVLEKMYEDSEK